METMSNKSVSELISEEPQRSLRESAKDKIHELINDYSLKGPEGYGVTFEGMTCARWQPWIDWNAKGAFDTALSADRLYMVWQYAMAAPKGDFYEFGVYKGGVTEMLSIMCNSENTVHAFDTFDGLKGAGKHDMMVDGEYKAEIPKFKNNVVLHVGDVKSTFKQFTNMSFCHIDLDLYEPTLHVLPIVYNSMCRGGFIVIDDYGLWMTPGVKKAVNEFLGMYKDIKHIYLPTGQMVILI